MNLMYQIFNLIVAGLLSFIIYMICVGPNDDDDDF